MNASSRLNELRLIGHQLSVPSEKARAAYAKKLFDNLVPPDVESIKRKFGLDPTLGQEANVKRLQEDVLAGRMKGAVMDWQLAENWANSAFAQVVVGAKLFASLAETRIPQEAIPDFGVPWDCFVIRIPEEFELPPIEWGPGLKAPIAYLTCERLQDNPNRLLGTERPIWEKGKTMGDSYMFSARPGIAGAALWCNFHQPSDLLSAELSSGTGVHSWDGSSWVENEEDQHNAKHTPRQFDAQKLAVQQLGVMRRAFVGVLMELMNSPESKGHARATGCSRNGRRSGKPKSFTLTLTRDVVVDCRAQVKAKLRGQRPPSNGATVQVLVRGHWKNQRCGPGGRERKFIHIEPYWRGPEDAPIAVRPHVLKG